MCGINGIFAYHSASSAPKGTELLTTREAMRARGPDGLGAWWNVDRRCGLGHRRLSIIDLSDRASQPMASEDNRFVVVFNGEIYNYPQLRAELENDGVRFRTTSDTEALLHLYAHHGAEMVHRLRGMFAFAIWDEVRRGLFLARVLSAFIYSAAYRSHSRFTVISELCLPVIPNGSTPPGLGNPDHFSILPKS